MDKPNQFSKTKMTGAYKKLFLSSSKTNRLNAYDQAGHQPCLVFTWDTSFIITDMCKLVQKFYKLFAVFDTCLLFCKNDEVQKIKCQC